MTTLTDYIKTSTGFAESTIDAVINGAIGFITTSLRSGEEVRIDGLGIFKVTDKPERPGRNPRTGETITLKASRKVKLAFGKSFLGSIQPDPSLAPVAVTAPVASPVSTPAAPTLTAPIAPPPIPSELLAEQKAQLELMWQIKAPDGSFVEVASSELSNWGVAANTPVYSTATGWKLAGKIPELAGIVS